MTATIEIDAVGRRYGSTWALRDATFALGAGVTGLLGPNGAGKTTLLRILATALPPTTGTLALLGLDPAVPAQQTRIRRHLGYLPQELGFPRGFTAFEFVDYVAVLKEWTHPGARHEEVARVLDAVGLTDSAAKRIRALSGGQRRRLGLAQALLGAPEDPGPGRADYRPGPRATRHPARRAGRGRPRRGRRALDPSDRGPGRAV